MKPHPLKQYIDAFTSGQKVQCLNHSAGSMWGDVTSLRTFESKEFTFRIAPRTLRLGNREVPVPSLVGGPGMINLAPSHVICTGFWFPTEKERADFSSALAELVKDNS